jgi:uncharacterized iron-regulated protein
MGTRQSFILGAQLNRENKFACPSPAQDCDFACHPRQNIGMESAGLAREISLEREIKELDRQIREAKRAATGAMELQAKLERQKEVQVLEKQRNQKRRSPFDAQDEVDNKRDELIAQIEGKLEQKTTLKSLFILRWKLI